ncbi:hypothetical protein, partial [Aliiroseovarius sp.]|uniref:hypothetical protein n=1 Tax=Aliiroseovarius sp. TaxID=1872442 RepID=UPI002626299B
MIARTALLCLWLLPGVSWAQVVTLRSGEHADFSRLVLQFDTRVAWRFGRVDGGYEIRVDAPEMQFDTRGVFDLIPRTRIVALEDRGNGRLFISSNCPCYGDAFDLRASEVVLDIKDGPAPRANSPFNQELNDVEAQAEPAFGNATVSAAAEAPLDVPAPEATPPGPDSRAVRFGLPITFSYQTPLPHPGLSPDRDKRSAVVDLVTDFIENEPVLPQASKVAAPAQDRVSETEEELLLQIGRAAAQGLLDADLQATEAAVEVALNPAPDPGREGVPQPFPVPPQDPIGHMQIQTVIDRDMDAATPDRPATTRDGLACLPAEYFDLANWGRPPNDGAVLSTHRAGLLGEFDQANPDHVLGLVRNYIYLTFGAEAIAVLRRFGAEVQRPDLLVMMGEIMDSGESTNPAAISDQMACSGPVALWATLAQPSLSPAADIDRSSVIKSFSDLPLHLRRHLGPGLAQSFLDIGDVSTANALRDAVARAPGRHGAGFDLLEAGLDRSNGDAERANARLEEIIREDDPLAPDALLQLVGARMEAGQPVEDRWRRLLTSMAYEHRGTKTGEALLTTALRAELYSARFDRALVLLGEAAETYGAETVEVVKLREAFLMELVENAEDTAFLMHAISESSRISLMPSPVRQAVAGRFLDLGFAAPARAVLSNSHEVSGPKDRLLFAQIALLEGKPGVAMGYLAGLEG